MRGIAIAGLAFSLSPAVYSSAAPVPPSQETPRMLLRQMTAAVNHLDYEGTFVYQRGSTLNTLKLLHAWQGGEVRERLISQDGSQREVLIDGNAVTYIRPSVKSIVIMRRHARSGLPGGVGADSASNPFYRPRLDGVRRVAGMSCRVVVLQPSDDLRYARRMCIGLHHHLPLETEVVDRKGRVVERMLFTSLNVVKSLPPSAFVPPALGSGYTLKRLRDAASKRLADWRLSQLPRGFKLQVERERNLGNDGQHVRQLVLSDGVSAVSVFIAPGDGHAATGRFLHSGALNVYSTSIHDHDVTVMGEVPKRTIRHIAAALTYRSDSSR